MFGHSRTLLQKYECYRHGTSLESVLGFLLNSFNFVDLGCWAFDFDFLFQPLLKMANNGLKQRIGVRSLMFKICRT